MNFFSWRLQKFSFAKFHKLANENFCNLQEKKFILGLEMG